LLNSVNDVRQSETHTTEPLLHEPCSPEVKIATENLKRYKFPGTDQILAALIQIEGNTLRSEIHKLISSVWNKGKLPQQREESIIVPIYKNGDKTNFNNYIRISLLSTMYKILSILITRLTQT